MHESVSEMCCICLQEHVQSSHPFAYSCLSILHDVHRKVKVHLTSSHMPHTKTQSILYVLNLNAQYPTAGLRFCQQLLLTKHWWQHPVSHSSRIADIVNLYIHGYIVCTA